MVAAASRRGMILDRDSYALATPLALNTSLTGNIDVRNDVDFYSFQLRQPGLVRLVFEHVLIDSYSRYWAVELLNDQLTYCIVQLYAEGKPLTAMSQFINLSAGKYYVKVYRPFSRWSTSDYQLMVEYVD